MKNILIYMLTIVFIIVILPLLIIKSCVVQIESPPDVVKPVKTQIKLTIYDKDKSTIQSMDFEEYIKGVLAAEMPAEFDIEALKAQAVAARTYAYRKYLTNKVASSEVYSGADVSTDFKDCQAWISKDEALAKWKKEMKSIYWNKICRAVDDTKGIILTYKGNIINAVYHANSGGATENSEDVWKGQVEPYLRSVESDGEDLSPTYKTSITLTAQNIIKAIQKEYPDNKINEKDVLKDLQILGYTSGGRIDEIRVGQKTISGTEFRKIFELRSSNFLFTKNSNGTICITCKGYGHGVGLSQWGSNSMAQMGSKYSDILKHYYTGITLDTIVNYESKQ